MRQTVRSFVHDNANNFFDEHYESDNPGRTLFWEYLKKEMEATGDDADVEHGHAIDPYDQPLDDANSSAFEILRVINAAYAFARTCDATPDVLHPLVDACDEACKSIVNP